MSEVVEPIQMEPWPALGRELGVRTLQPLRHPSFVIYFLVAIVILGPIGFWMEVIGYATDPSPDVAKVRASLVSFVPAFVAATTLQLVWAERMRSLRAVAVLILVVCVLFLFLCANSRITNLAAIWSGCFSAIISLWMWWIANANQLDFHDDVPNPENPVGGSLNRELSGSLDGWTTE